MKKTAIILAGGSGTRAGGGMPKQFRTLGGEPMLFRPVAAFAREDSGVRIIIVVNPSYFTEWADQIAGFCDKNGIAYQVVAGGASRRESVENALAVIPDEEGMVAVHDAARPMVSVPLISRGWEACGGMNSVVPAVPLSDSIRRIDGAGESHSVDRSSYLAVQTPQVFPTRILKRAYSVAPQDSRFTDDASIVEACGEKIIVYEGEPDNMKVTNPRDFAVAEALLKSIGE